MRSALALAIVLTAKLFSVATAQAAEPVAPPDLPPADTWVPTGGGQIRVLDKQKAQSHLIALKTGQTATFETLSLTMLACDIHPPSIPGNEAGFLQITDSRAGEPGFHGWMIARQPGLATLQSPVYGVRIVGCEKPTEAAIEAALPPKPPPPSSPPPSPPPLPTVSTPASSASDLNPPPGQDLTPPADQSGGQ